MISQGTVATLLIWGAWCWSALLSSWHWRIQGGATITKLVSPACMRRCQLLTQGWQNPHVPVVHNTYLCRLVSWQIDWTVKNVKSDFDFNCFYSFILWVICCRFTMEWANWCEQLYSESDVSAQVGQIADIMKHLLWQGRTPVLTVKWLHLTDCVCIYNTHTDIYAAILDEDERPSWSVCSSFCAKWFPRDSFQQLISQWLRQSHWSFSITLSGAFKS